MRIGLVLASAPGYSETFFNSKIKGLIAHGHSVTLFCANIPDTYSLCKTRLFPKRYSSNLFQIFNMFWIYLSLIPYLTRVIRFYRISSKRALPFFEILKRIYFNAPILKSKLDWLHFGFGTLALGREALSEAIGARMAVSFRGFDIGVYPIKHPNCYEELWERVDKIHVISNDLQNLIYKHGFDDQVPIVKITPAIDTGLFSSSSAPVALHDPVRILTVARLHWKKGLDYTLEALSLLKKEGVSFLYTIIGTGDDYEHLVYLASQLDLIEEISFIGKLSAKEVMEYMQNADVYLQYSVQEGFCNAVLEAQAMGLLCIVSDAEGLPENVLNGETGWVVPKRNPQLLAQKVRQILTLDAIENANIRKQAINRIQADFNLKKQIKEFLEFYNSSN